MAGDFRKLKLARFAPTEERETPEARFWARYRFPIQISQTSPVSCIDFCATEPHHFAVTSGTRVALFDAKTNKATRSVTRFKDVARSGRYRGDGRLLVAGCDDAVVKVFDLASKSILRAFVGHKGPVHFTSFSTDKTHVVSASDDKTVRHWDVPAGVCTATMTGHTDYIRCGAAVAGSPLLWATGSYDHTVRLWDVRLCGSAEGAVDGPSGGSGGGGSGGSSGGVMTVDHGAPVTQVLSLPGGGSIVTSGGNVVKVWSLLAGGKLMHEFSNHQKTITSLCLDGSGSRLLSASLDCHVKVYDLMTFSVAHQMKYPAPILAVAVAPDNSRVVVGMSDHMLSVKQRITQVEDPLAVSTHSASYRYFLRGKSSAPVETDLKVKAGRKLKLRPYEDFLKKFQYQNALDAALESRDPVVVVSVLEELRQRDGIFIALKDRDDTMLEPLITFLAKYITNPRYSAVLITLANTLLDMYSAVLGRSFATDRLFLRLQSRIDDEIKLDKQLMALQGGLDLVLASSTASSAR